MDAMTYERTKVAPWENYADGEWHEVRRGPEDESRDESLRQVRRHWESMRAWAAGKGLRGQLSRRENGRIIKVRFTAAVPNPDLRLLSPLTRGQLGRGLLEAMRLLDYAMNLRAYGEGRHPDGTWQQFDREAELFLRKLRRDPEVTGK